MKLRVPGRVIEFSTGGESYLAFERGEDPATSKELDADEHAWFTAVLREGKEVRPSKGGYYVIAELSPPAVQAARYWAETLESASQDNARDGDPDARNDVRAAARLLNKLL